MARCESACGWMVVSVLVSLCAYAYAVCDGVRARAAPVRDRVPIYPYANVNGPAVWLARGACITESPLHFETKGRCPVCSFTSHACGAVRTQSRLVNYVAQYTKEMAAAAAELEQSGGALPAHDAEGHKRQRLAA
eukprot:5231390-Pleurochrysis_carterae.AAC.5